MLITLRTEFAMPLSQKDKKNANSPFYSQRIIWNGKHLTSENSNNAVNCFFFFFSPYFFKVTFDALCLLIL